jgi:hypothetical protein
LHLDKKGRLWLSTAFSGISRVDDLNAEVLSFLLTKPKTGWRVSLKRPTKIGALPPNNELSIFQICQQAIIGFGSGNQ